MLVQIVNGTYGHVEEGKVVRKTAKDAPFELEAEKAQRLLDLGVAQPAEAAAPGPQEDEEPPENKAPAKAAKKKAAPKGKAAQAEDEEAPQVGAADPVAE